jgi:hypothetical protein
MRRRNWFPCLAVLLAAAAAMPARPAAAQQLISGMTGSACAAHGGQITTWTNTAGVGPNVGDCYIPPRFGSGGAPTGGGGGGGNRAAAALGALGAGFTLLEALSNLFDSVPDSTSSEPHPRSEWDDYLNSPEYQREKREWDEQYTQEQRAKEAALDDKTDDVSNFIRSGPAKPKAAADPCAAYPPGPAGVAQCYQAAARALEQQAGQCSGGCRAAMLRAAASARCVAALRPAGAEVSSTVAKCTQDPAAGLQRVASATDQPKAAATKPGNAQAPRTATGASQAPTASASQSAADWQRKCQQLEQAKDDSAISCWGGLSSSLSADPTLRAYARQRAQQLERTTTFQASPGCPYGNAQSGIAGTECVSNTISQGTCSQIGGIWYPSINGSTAKCLYERQATAANSPSGPGARQARKPHSGGAPGVASIAPPGGDGLGDCGPDCGSRGKPAVSGDCGDIGGFHLDDGACWVMGVTTSDCEDVLRGMVAERGGHKYCRVENAVIEGIADNGGNSAPERRSALQEMREELRRDLTQDAEQQDAATEEAAVERRLEREWYGDAVARYKAWIASGKAWFAEDTKARDACPGSWLYDGTNPGRCDATGPKRVWEVQFGQAPARQQTADANSAPASGQPPALPPCDPAAPGWHTEEGSSGEATVVADPARRCTPLFDLTVPKPGEKF